MAVMKDMMDTWRDAYSVRKVFGDPIEKAGFTVIPVAMVAGGAGGGTEPADGETGPESGGGGFGGMARPSGVYVVRADGVEWQPAVDVTVLGIAGIALVALMTVVLGRALRRRR